MKDVLCAVAIPLASCAVFLSGCQRGRVELGNDRAVGEEASTQGDLKNVFLSGQAGVKEVFVDDSRVYWVTVAENQVAPPASFRSCLKDDCSSTIVTYVEDRTVIGPPLDVAIDSNNVYWLRWGSVGISPAVLSCPLSGCASKTTTVIAGGGTVDHSLSMVSDGTYLYWTSTVQTSVFRCRPDNCSETLVAIALTQSDPKSLVVSAGYAYWVASEEEGSFAVRRTSVDGKSQVETIVTGQNQTTTLAVREPHVYFDNYSSAGTISVCPTTGCVGSPTVIAASLNLATGVIADEEYIYSLEAGDDAWGRNGSLVRCSVQGCENGVTKLADTETNSFPESHPVALDDNNVYWVNRGKQQDASGRYGFPNAVIHRIAK